MAYKIKTLWANEKKLKVKTFFKNLFISEIFKKLSKNSNPRKVKFPCDGKNIFHLIFGISKTISVINLSTHKFKFKFNNFFN